MQGDNGKYRFLLKNIGVLTLAILQREYYLFFLFQYRASQIAVYNTCSYKYFITQRIASLGKKDLFIMVYYGFHLWWKYALMTDKRYGEQYLEVYPSYIYTRSKYQILTAMKKRTPKLFRVLSKLKRRMTRRKDS